MTDKDVDLLVFVKQTKVETGLFFYRSLNQHLDTLVNLQTRFVNVNDALVCPDPSLVGQSLLLRRNVLPLNNLQD